MSTLTKIAGILMFAVITAFLYGWGIKKSVTTNEELLNILYLKGEEKILKFLRKNEKISVSDGEKLLTNLKASLVYSKNRAVVKDKKAFAETLLKRMTDKEILEKRDKYYIKRGK